MFQVCRHIKTNGVRCKSPALRESAYCYFHVKIHKAATAKASASGDLTLPPIEDPASIQIGLTQVLSALGSSRIDTRKAGLLLYALQIASQNVDRRAYVPASDSVRSLTCSDDGDELAPAISKCEYPADCPGCPKRENCDVYNDDDDDDDDDDD